MKNENLEQLVAQVVLSVKNRFTVSDADDLEQYTWLLLIADYPYEHELQMIIYQLGTDEIITFKYVKRIFPDALIVTVLQHIVKQQ